MGKLDNLLKKNPDIEREAELSGQTWSEFERNIRNKKVILFGAGIWTDLFWTRYNGKIEIEGLVDNDSRKHGRRIEDYQAESFGKKGGKSIIFSFDDLKKYDPNEVVILICSSNSYKEIRDQLAENGYNQAFILPYMEVNEKRALGEAYCSEMQERESRERFVKECSTLPVNTNKIVLNDSYGGHQKPIVEQLLKIRKDLDIVWVTNDLSKNLFDGVRNVYAGNWKKCAYELETAKVWIWDLCVPDYIIKREEQKFIQTKHWASITLKKFALEDPVLARNESLYSEFIYNSKLMDYIIVGSSFDEESCRRGFNFDKNFLRIGSPRSDVLFCGEDNKATVYEYYGIDKKYRTLLYAPTFRYDLTKQGVSVPEMKGTDVDFEQLKNALETRFGGEWKIFLRLHPSIAKYSKTIERPDYVIDATMYGDSQELVAASDILMTDYSSIMFEASFVEKPVFLYASDKKDYIGKERDLLLDFDTLPFPVAETNKELKQIIKQFDEKSYHRRVSAFLESYGVHEDGHASERAAQFISDIIDGKKV